MISLYLNNTWYDGTNDMYIVGIYLQILDYIKKY